VLPGDDPQPLRHQVLELPQVEPIVLEYQRHRLLCPYCGVTTCGDLPQGVPQGGQGPRLQATLALLTGAYRLSKRQVEVLMDDLFGVPVCAATVCSAEQEVAATLDPVVEEMRAYVRGQPVNMDETSWWQGQQRAWLWVAVTQYLTIYHLVAPRGAKVVREVLGPGYRRTLTSDRFKSYAFLALSRRQLCWAHLRRDFQAMIDRNNAGSAVGRGPGSSHQMGSMGNLGASTVVDG
jgi:transposase